jgi:hypothetical protein
MPDGDDVPADLPGIPTGSRGDGTPEEGPTGRATYSRSPIRTDPDDLGGDVEALDADGGSIEWPSRRLGR